MGPKDSLKTEKSMDMLVMEGRPPRFSRYALADKIANDRIRKSTKKSKKASQLLPNRISANKKIANLKEEIDLDDHLLTLEQIQLRYDTDLKNGLTEEEALRLLKIWGPNVIIKKKRKSRIILFVRHMFYGFSLVLWAGVTMTMTGFGVQYMKDPAHIPYEQLYIGIAIFTVLMITGIFGYTQENTNVNIMESFLKMVPKKALVTRDGTSQVISSADLVVGDLVELNAGSCVPADLRIVECMSMKVDNSSVTGESEPQSRDVKRTDDNPLETKNLAFYGTSVVEGSGKGIVVACGDNTLMGHLAILTSELEPEETPIKRELRQFIQKLVMLALVIGSTFFGLAMLMKYDLFQSIVFFIGLCVATVPEGLLVTMTASLTLTAKKMAKKNCLCKNLHAIETLGSTTVICSDKTGTLTKNKMTVSHLYYDSNIFDILAAAPNKKETPVYKALCRCAILCSRAEFISNTPTLAGTLYMVIKGDASESAILRCMEKMHGGTVEYKRNHPKIFEIPFNSRLKYQLSVHKIIASNELILVIKGAPERILERCITIYETGATKELTKTKTLQLEQALMELGKMGERVLGFADFMLPSSYTDKYPFDEEKENFPVTGFRFLGFISMIDPPRTGVTEAIAKCKTAGIRVVMVTGDHPVTAMAISRKVGIISEHSFVLFDRERHGFSNMDEVGKICNAAVLTGADIKNFSQVDLDIIVRRYKELVFARTSPQQKLVIVEAFQNAGEVVAVTGDGVNDSPALKKANIGVAMGISGSEVSKEAADMIILDDNFASIVVGVEEGRLIFDNLKKSIAYMLTSNLPEMMPFLVHIAFSIPLPLTIMAILIINVGTDLWPGISFAYESAESDIMHRKPRDTKRDMLVTPTLLLYTNINIGLIQAVSGLSCYFCVMAEHGFLPLTLIGIRDNWYSEKNDVIDSYGQEWTVYERRILLKKCVTAYFFAVVITQVADCLICKTRRNSLVHQGMHNWVLNFGILFEICLAIFVVHCPYLNEVLGFTPVGFYAIAPGILFAISLIVLDEIRKYLIRTYPHGWVARELYY